LSLEPIAKSAAGAPIAFPALGFAFHLEPLVPADASGLAKATDRILAVIGPKLRWQWSSVHGEVEPFSAGAFDLIAALPGQLDDSAAQAVADERARAGASAMNAAHYDKLGVACHGGADRNVASPFTVRFFSRVTPSGTPLLRADAMLAATMPIDTPLAELQKLAIGVASDLRIRWGALGYTYGAWELDRYGDARAAIFAHARKHPGYDVGQHTTYMRELHDRLRTVSWMTFVGPGLIGNLAIAPDPLIGVAKAGEATVLRAGERPEPGDVNRKQIPLAYQRVDALLRPLRASTGLHFYAPWSAATTEAWLRRFE
jgi:hypothetical protein